jgi:hypothetical protein
MRRRVLLAVALALPFAVSAGGSRRLATWSGARLGGALAEGISALPRASLLDPAPSDLAPPSDRDETRVVLEEAPEPVPTRGEKGRASAVAHGAHGIHVRAATVLRLAAAGVHPTGTPVPASGSRPAGLALHGVGRLGVGLRDGDVLTDVAGAPATSPAAVVGAVLAARANRAPAMSGHVWREATVWQIVVDMPYPR